MHLLLLLLGLAQAADPGAPPSDVVAVLQGFDLQWQARPHRLRQLGVAVQAQADADGVATGILSAHVRGGSWADGSKASDHPALRLAYAGLSSSRRKAVEGSVQLELQGRYGVASGVRVPGDAQVHVDVPLPDGATGAAVFLSGFQVDSGAAHPDGFTMHALALQLSEATVHDGLASFDVSAHLVAAAVPDRSQHLQSYGADVRIDYVVLPTSAGEATRVHAEGRVAHGIALASAVDAMPPARVPVQADLAADGVFAGLSGLSVRVAEPGYASGRYMRELGVRLVDLRYDPHAARASAELELVFSNAGPVQRPVDAVLAADVTLVPLQADEQGWTGQWTGSMETPDLQVIWPSGMRGG